MARRGMKAGDSPDGNTDRDVQGLGAAATTTPLNTARLALTPSALAQSSLTQSSLTTPSLAPPSGLAALPANATMMERLATAELECETLRAALATAEARIADLEKRQAEIANRVSWALDSLQTLLDEGG